MKPLLLVVENDSGTRRLLDVFLEELAGPDRRSFTTAASRRA
jgi:hypothetical protein